MRMRKRLQLQRLDMKGGRTVGRLKRKNQTSRQICRAVFYYKEWSAYRTVMRLFWIGGSFLHQLACQSDYSVLSQNISLLLEYASSPIASHFLDSILTSPAVSPKYRRKLLSAFLGHYKTLAEDRLGSRVADTIWAKADGFMKVCLPSASNSTWALAEGTGENRKESHTRCHGPWNVSIWSFLRFQTRVTSSQSKTR